jgi:hypothetical protein
MTFSESQNFEILVLNSTRPSYFKYRRTSYSSIVFDTAIRYRHLGDKAYMKGYY